MSEEHASVYPFGPSRINFVNSFGGSETLSMWLGKTKGSNVHKLLS